MKLSFLASLILLLAACPSMTAQSPVYTTVTATLTDSSTQLWANASVTATFQPPFNNPNKPLNNGIAVITPVTAFANASGVLTINLDASTTVTPAGGVWSLTICPNATVPVCSQGTITTTGNSQNSSALISSFLTPVSVSVVPALQRAYNDGEASGPQGAIYWRVSDNTLRGFNGTGWAAIGGGGGGGSSSWDALTAPLNNLTLAMGNFLTNFQYGSATGAGSPDFDISDANTNNGTNTIFRIHSGTASTSPPLAICSHGLVDCVVMTTSGMFEPIGNAQIVATSVNNGTAGIGTLDLGSNGAMSNGNSSQIRLAGNFNKLYVSENSLNPYKVPMRVYSNGATITQTGDTNEHVIYTIANFPAQLADGNFRITVWFNPTTQGAGNSHYRVKVNGSALIDNAIVTAQQGGNAIYTANVAMAAATNAQNIISYFNSNAPLGVPLLGTSTAIDMTNSSTVTVTYQGANNTDAMTFKYILIEEL